MKNDLKLKIKVQDQQMTFWEIVKKEDTYIMFRASITSGKKNPDGTWDNVSQNFTCFCFYGNAENNSRAETLLSLKEKAKIKVSGSLTMLPEKRTAQGKNGEYQEPIFSGFTFSIDTIELVDGKANASGSNNYAKESGKSDVDNEKDCTTYSEINDDIPF